MVYGDEHGDLLVVGWGSTRGAIEEAVDRMRADGHAVSSLHLRFLSPARAGLKEIFARFKRVMTVEINYSDQVGDDPIDRREPALLPARLGCCARTRWWTSTAGRACRASPLPPSMIEDDHARPPARRELMYGLKTDWPEEPQPRY